ncbi:MAG: hypothetical protein ACR2F6_18505 [Mycobacteriales bacterium]
MAAGPAPAADVARYADGVPDRLDLAGIVAFVVIGRWGLVRRARTHRASCTAAGG